MSRPLRRTPLPLLPGWLAAALLAAPADADEPREPGEATGSEAEADYTLPVHDIQGGDFTLHAADGRDVDLADFRGKVVLLNFGFTSCPDVCPLTLTHLRRLLDQLGDDARYVQVLFVSFDPARDSPEGLARYVAHFHEDFVGVTGTPEEVRQAARRYHVRYLRRDGASEDGYAFAHTDDIFVLDPYGRLRARFRPSVPLGMLEDEVRRHIVRK